MRLKKTAPGKRVISQARQTVLDYGKLSATCSVRYRWPGHCAKLHSAHVGMLLVALERAFPGRAASGLPTQQACAPFETAGFSQASVTATGTHRPTTTQATKKPKIQLDFSHSILFRTRAYWPFLISHASLDSTVLVGLQTPSAIGSAYI